MDEVENMREEALALCKDFLGGRWQTVSLEEFKLSQLSGGFSNKLYLCALPEGTAEDSRTPHEVVLRMYGAVQADANHLVSEAVTFMMLSERKLGPKLYGLFPKGRLEEYIPSHFLNVDEMQLYALPIAREMAKIHALDVPVRKVPDMIQKLTLKWTHELEKEFSQKDLENYFMPYSEFRKVIEWSIEEQEKLNCPVVYCHNDLQGGNILYREGVSSDVKPNLVLIDFEFASYNYRSYDFAAHFCERCFHYFLPEYPHFRMDTDRYPSRQEQVEFITAYLDQLSKEGIPLKRSLQEEVDSVLREVILFSCAFHLTASVWAIKMEPTGMGHREFAKVRLDEAMKFRERYLASS